MKNFTLKNLEKAKAILTAAGIDSKNAENIAINAFVKYSVFKDYIPNVESVLYDFLESDTAARLRRA